MRTSKNKITRCFIVATKNFFFSIPIVKTSNFLDMMLRLILFLTKILSKNINHSEFLVHLTSYLHVIRLVSFAASVPGLDEIFNDPSPFNAFSPLKTLLRLWCSFLYDLISISQSVIPSHAFYSHKHLISL